MRFCVLQDREPNIVILVGEKKKKEEMWFRPASLQVTSWLLKGTRWAGVVEDCGQIFAFCGIRGW